jgi:gliding motility-associated-like protein
MTVSVNQQLNTSFSQLPPICEGELFVLPSSSIEGINGTWSPSINNLVTTTYIFTPNTGECATEASLTVNVNPNPIISAGIPQIVCIGDLITLQGTGAGVGGTYTWSNNVINNVPFNVNETNTYNLVGTDVNGCSGSASITITALPYPNAQFGASPNQGEVALLVQFTNSSQNANNYLWDFGNGQNVQVNDLSNQQTIYNEPGQYTVWLIASNGYCIDSTSTVITVLAEPWIFVPNVFSPNEDGANELWMIDTKNINSIELIILNRWGNVMAKISDIEGGWDGKTLNGSDATEGTYFYKYEAKATNGKDFSGHGFLTLIR